jgi:hypothetical protein
MPDSNRQFPVRVDLRLTEEEREYLNEEALKRGISRQELLRAKVLTDENEPVPIPKIKPIHYSSGRDSIDRAIDAVTRIYSYVPRQKLEPIVCTVICALNARPE